MGIIIEYSEKWNTNRIMELNYLTPEQDEKDSCISNTSESDYVVFLGILHVCFG